MRLIISLIVFVVFQLLAIARLGPVTVLSETETLLLSVVLTVWTLAEAYWTIKQLQTRSESESHHQADSGQKAQPQQVDPTPQRSTQNSLLESERDELRSRVTQLTLRQKELEELVTGLKRKLADVQSSASQGVSETRVSQNAVVSLVGTLQEKGRLIDFLMDDISAYSDEQVGAAARVVHQGCRAALREQLELAPVFQGSEGSQLTLDKGYAVAEWRLAGKVVSQPPYRGQVTHHGWKISRFNLSRITSTQDSSIVAPAELEIV